MIAYSLTASSPGYTLTINGDDLAKIAAQMNQSLAGFKDPPEALKGEVIPPVDAKPAGKRGPKAKGEAAAPVQTDIEDVTNAPVEEAKPVTHDDVIEAMKKVNGKHGMQAVRELLQPFGCQAIKELKVEQYADAIAAAEKKMAE